MTPERWSRVKVLFDETCERPVEERAAFLDNASAGDAELRGEVEALLHSDEAAAGFICKDAGVARRRFGISEDEYGICYTRTGRRFFSDAAIEASVIDRVRSALGAAGFWDELETDWVCLDCELMPWSAKAEELLRDQYASVGAAGRAALAESLSVLERAGTRAGPLEELVLRLRQNADDVQRYTDAYRRYCWRVRSIDDLRLAPFHILAIEGTVHVDRDHAWHMETITRICRHDPQFLFATQYMQVDLTDGPQEKDAIRWWVELTERGGEGMVVKPRQFVARGRRDLVQPAIKCRGREYLCIIYGPEYTSPDNLERLRSRGLSVKHSLAIREFALGIEALERFVGREPLRRVHEGVFGVLALESEPVDPRL